MLTLQELQARLHRAIQERPEIDPLAVALSIVTLTQTIEEHDIATPDNRPVFTLGTALFVALREMQARYPLYATEDAPFREQPDVGRALANDAEGVFSDEYVAVHRTAGREYTQQQREQLRLNAIWMLAENGIFQGDLVPRLAIALVLTGLAGFRGLPPAPDETNALFRRRMGVSAHDYVQFCLAVWAISRAQPLIQLPLVSGTQQNDALESTTRAVIGHLARQADRFADLSDAPHLAGYSGKALPSALLQRWPLIKLNDNHFLVSAPPFLKIQLSSKLLTKALAFARQEAAPTERARTAYSVFVGQHRLEPFVRELCELWCPLSHFDEYEYLRSGNQLSADRIVFERHGANEVAILIQLKLKMVLEATHFGVTADALAKDLGSALSETLYKSVQFLAAIDEAAANGALRPDTEHLTRRILACRHLCLVGIVPEIPPMFTMSDVRALLMSDAVARLSARERAWLDRNQHRLVWHVIGLDEFLLFLKLPARERHLYKRLAAYFRDAGPNRLFIEGGRMPVSFRNYLATKYAGHLDGGWLGVDDIAQAMFENARQRFAGT